ncbi:hypothetical protein C8Q76DRAFT_605714 [Earliella scabrosa]|nr:hypothetical protein C8Q76DRAFT_605714 [Earliella scabrosa]
MSSREMAKWLLNPNVAAVFTRKLGATARIVERTYKLVAERVPTDFDPQDQQALRVVEEAHGLKSGAIVQAEWIKPVERRYPGQRFAFLMLTVNSVEQANRALKGLTLAGRRVIVRREIEEPKCCLKCQALDGHLARECAADHDTCGTCAGCHPTSQCTVTDTGSFRCVNCNLSGHTAWDCDCPVFRAQVCALSSRRADAGFRFFVTNNPETWISEEEVLAHAPPPPTLWSQIRQRFDDADAGTPGLLQTRLQMRNAQRKKPTQPTQQ